MSSYFVTNSTNIASCVANKHTTSILATQLFSYFALLLVTTIIRVALGYFKGQFLINPLKQTVIKNNNGLGICYGQAT